jgi:outer membrane protein TolC
MPEPLSENFRGGRGQVGVRQSRGRESRAERRFKAVIPAAPSSSGYVGVIASYDLFDFGKREHAVKEARAQVGMAENGAAPD